MSIDSEIAGEGEESPAYDRGFTAYGRWSSYSQGALSTNPYQEGTTEADDFYRGWKAGEEQHEADLNPIGKGPGWP